MPKAVKLEMSVVTPCLNCSQFLEEALRSVVCATSGAQVEHIVIDGGSQDSTLEILEARSACLEYWLSEPDRGQSHAINKGLAKATGDVLGYLNSDDLYLPGALDAVAEAVRENPDADLFYGRCRTIDEAGQPLPKVFAGNISSAEEVLDLWDVWWGGRNFVQPEVFWTRRIMEKVGLFREDLHYAMDYDYWCRCFLAGAKAVRIDADLAAFRLWDGQKSKAADGAARELRDVVRRHLDDAGAPISRATRRRLKARLAFDTEFLPLVARSIEANESRFQRWSRVTKLLLDRPQIALSRPLWKRARTIALARMPFGLARGSAGAAEK